MAIIEELGGHDALRALERIEHIVVVMMENRSFDHMLGHLTLDGRADVDGLRADMANVHDGRTYRVFPLTRTDCERWEDPDHSGDGVALQMQSGNGGFVTSYLESIPEEMREPVAARDDVFPMGYLRAHQVPAFRDLAAEFCVCDRWFSSVPGATWPNRLYAVCGHSGGRKDNKKLFGKLDWPLHHYPSFVRHLDDRGVDWRWYHARPSDVEPPTVAVADMRYLLGHTERFALFDRPEPVSGQPSFLDDAREGRLPAVSWVDPDFGVTKRESSNDDHPPADVRRGQAFLRDVCEAVMRGPGWARTLLVITYDEHGGFFDHVPPPPAPDDDEHMRRYGVRVPALVMSPYVERASVARSTFDHTSLVKTVLARHWAVHGDEMPYMGTRVALARHLGHLLTLDVGRPAPAPVAPDLVLPDESEASSLDVEHARQVFLAMPRVANGAAEALLSDRGGPPPSSDLQVGLLRAGLERQALRGERG